MAYKLFFPLSFATGPRSGPVFSFFFIPSVHWVCVRFPGAPSPLTHLSILVADSFSDRGRFRPPISQSCRPITEGAIGAPPTVHTAFPASVLDIRTRATAMGYRISRRDEKVRGQGMREVLEDGKSADVHLGSRTVEVIVVCTMHLTRPSFFCARPVSPSLLRRYFITTLIYN